MLRWRFLPQLSILQRIMRPAAIKLQKLLILKASTRVPNSTGNVDVDLIVVTLMVSHGDIELDAWVTASLPTLTTASGALTVDTGGD